MAECYYVQVEIGICGSQCVESREVTIIICLHCLLARVSYCGSSRFVQEDT